MSFATKAFTALTTGAAIATLHSAGQPPQSTTPAGAERHLRNIRQLTFGGENAEAYFSSDGTRLIFQSTREGVPCDQIFTMKLDGSDLTRVSTGKGRTTCGYFYPGAKEILYASTHLRHEACPPKPSFERGYVWPIYDTYDIYRANPDGSNLRPLTTTPGYDAEATIAPDGLIAFTSVRDGDMEIYTMRGDGSGVRRLTNKSGARRRSVLLVRRPAHRVPRASALSRHGADGLPRVAEGQSLASDEAGALRDGSGWPEHREGDVARGRELRAVVASRRQALDLFFEREGSAASATSTSFSSISTARAWNRSRSITPSTASRCSLPTAGTSSSRPTATRKGRERPTSSSRSGSTRPLSSLPRDQSASRRAAAGRAGYRRCRDRRRQEDRPVRRHAAGTASRAALSLRFAMRACSRCRLFVVGLERCAMPHLLPARPRAGFSRPYGSKTQYDIATL